MILGALKTVSRDANELGDGATNSELALTGIKNITQNASVVVDLHSAVYIFSLAQALIKLVSDKDAYYIHIGKRLSNVFSSDSIV